MAGRSDHGGPERRLLYIAGYGRSGSTVLDIALSCHRQVAGVGELSGVFGALADPDAELSPFWREVAATTRAVPGDRSPADHRGGTPSPGGTRTEDLLAAAKVVTRAERLLPGLALVPWSRLRARHRRLHATLLDELFDRTGARVLVDSSKSSWLHTWRLPLLAGIVPETHCLIVVRDLPGVVHSVRRGHGETLEPQRLPTLRAVLGWALATVSAVLVARATCGPDRTHLVRHERFVADPAGHLAAAFGALGLDDDRAAIDDGVAAGFRPGHQILGNRVRSQGSVRIRAMPPTVTRLPAPARLAVAIVGNLVERLALDRVPTLVPTGTLIETGEPTIDAEPAA